MNREEIFKQEFCYEISECGRFFEHYSEDGIRRFMIMSIKELTKSSTTYWGIVREDVVEYIIANGEDKFARVWMFMQGKVASTKQYLDYALPCENMTPKIVVVVYPSSEYKTFCIDRSDDEDLKATTGAPAQPVQAYTCWQVGYAFPENDGNQIHGLNKAIEFLASQSEINEGEE